MADGSGMPEKLTVEKALKAYEDGYRIIAEWFNKAFDAWKIDLRIEADPAPPGVTLDDCRCRLSNMLVGYREHSPKLEPDDELFPWSVGFIRTESDKPGDKEDGIGLQKNHHSPWGSAEAVKNTVGLKHAYGWREGQWRAYVVEPMEEKARSSRKWLLRFRSTSDNGVAQRPDEEKGPAGQTGSKSPARTHSSEVLLSMESWEQLAIGIDEDGSYLAISPVPELGSVFPKEKAILLPLTGGRWKELLESLAYSEDGHTVSKKDLSYALGYRSGTVKREDIEELQDDAGAINEAKTTNKRLSSTVADLSYKLRQVVRAINDGRQRTPISASDCFFITATFTCRPLLRGATGKLEFGSQS